MFFLNSKVTYAEIVDGSSYTIFIGEKLLDSNDLTWMSGTRATLRNTGTAINKTLAITGVAAPALPAASAADGDAAAPSNAAAQAAPPAVDPAAPPASETPAVPAKPAKAAAPGSPLYVGGFGSRHPGVCNIAFGDGSVRNISAGVSGKVLEQLGHRNDGSLHDDSAF